MLTDATSYGYDTNGNLTSKTGEATYVWDHENRLVRVEKADGTVETVYDADGNRVSTTTTPAAGSPTTTHYLVDTSGGLGHVVAETDAANNLTALYVRGSDELLSVMRPSGAGTWTTRFFHADGIGSIRRLTNEAGTITDGYSYTAFGELLAHTGTDPQPYSFAGEPYDPNLGFQYHRARWMDPRVGRFAGMDPFGGRQEEPNTLHRYFYAGNEPVDRKDPGGLDFGLASSFTALSASFTISAISLPNARALISHNSIDIVPILLKRTGYWPGWPHGDVDMQLVSAARYWKAQLGPGYHVNIRTEIGPSEDELPGLSFATAKLDLHKLVKKHYRGPWTLNTIPVVFLASIAGTDTDGVTSTRNPKEPAAIALRYPAYGVDDLLLAHEIGHALSLQDVGMGVLPWRLMNGAGFIGEGLTNKELEDARRALAVRNGAP